MSGRLLYLLPHIFVAIKVEDICDKVKGVLIVLNVGIQSSQIEAVCEVVFVDFAEVLIASR